MGNVEIRTQFAPMGIVGRWHIFGGKERTGGGKPSSHLSHDVSLHFVMLWVMSWVVLVASGGIKGKRVLPSVLKQRNINGSGGVWGDNNGYRNVETPLLQSA